MTTNPATYCNERADRLAFADLRVLVIVALGGALEFYDFIIFAFFAPLIGRQFLPGNTPEAMATIQALLIFGAGYVVRPLGGIVLAHFGDLFGRQRVFAFSILLMTLSTLGMATLPGYVTLGVAAPILLLLLRMLQGAAIGGEVPGAWTLISEHFPLKRVGLACGVVCAGLSMGILIGSVAAGLTHGVLTTAQLESFGWRLPFVAGGGFGIVAVYLRSWLQETPVFTEMRRRRLLVQDLPLAVVLRDHPRGIIISVLLTWVLSACVVVVSLLNATVLQKYYGYSAGEAFAANSFGIVFVIIGTVCAGVLVDRIGCSAVLIFAGVLLGVTTLAFYLYAGCSLVTLFSLNAAMGLPVGISGAVPYMLVRAFPARVRFTGVSFSYNISYAVFGGSTPVAIAWLAEANVMAFAYYMLFIAFLTLSLGIYLLFDPFSIKYVAGTEEVGSTLL